MTRKVALHMIASGPVPEGPITTSCGRTSNGGGIGKMTFDFWGDRGPFIATQHDTLVTCKLCLRRMK